MLNQMYRLKIFILFIQNIRILLPRLLKLVFGRNKKIQYKIIQKQESNKYYRDTSFKLIILVSNALFIKINKSYMPILKDQSEVQIDYSKFDDEVTIKLIGFLKSIKIERVYQDAKSFAIPESRIREVKLKPNMNLNNTEPDFINNINLNMKFNFNKYSINIQEKTSNIYLDEPKFLKLGKVEIINLNPENYNTNN